MSVAGPVEEMDAPTIAMFRRFQAALLTLAHEWHDPDLEPRPAVPAVGAVYETTQDIRHTDGGDAPQSAPQSGQQIEPAVPPAAEAAPLSTESQETAA
jgi:hypothetical protein